MTHPDHGSAAEPTGSLAQPPAGGDREHHESVISVEGAEIHYDVIGDPTEPVPLFILGSPMPAADFAALAAQFDDRCVITYDPRGAGRSVKHDPATRSTPQQHATDLQAVVEATGASGVDVFASSGGAVNSLVWLESGAPVIRRLVAHEPPIWEHAPDRDQLRAVTRAIGESYRRDGFGPAMARFIAQVSHTGPYTDADVAAPPPDPAVFGLPTEDDGVRTDPLLFQNLDSCTGYVPDLARLRSSVDRLVLAIGEESRDVPTGRATSGLATALGVDPVWFPGGHGGFVADPRMGGDPAGFAARLREVLDPA